MESPISSLMKYVEDLKGNLFLGISKWLIITEPRSPRNTVEKGDKYNGLTESEGNPSASVLYPPLIGVIPLDVSMMLQCRLKSVFTTGDLACMNIISPIWLTVSGG